MSDQTRILLVEDDATIATTVCEALGSLPALVETASTIGDARACIRDRSFDVVVLDLGLPDGNGLDFAAALRSAGLEIPLLILTSRTGVPDRLAGFSQGADDYVCKPFVPEELAARVSALLRRSRPERSHLLRYAGIELDLLKRCVRREGQVVTLSDRETSLLSYFMRNREEAVSREQLAQEVFGLDVGADYGVVNVYVNYVRNKLEYDLGQPRLIHTIRGAGYMLSTVEPGEPERGRM